MGGYNMTKKLELRGQKFGRLTVIASAESDKKGNGRWLCKCDCGKEVVIVGYRLNTGYTKSCGCLQREITGKRASKHNKYGTRLHTVWRHMKERCNNPNSQDYHNYGGRGISYCSEWTEFNPFYEWATKNGYSDELTLDRIDVNGNYEPSNCRWADKKIQANNTRVNRRITINGVTKTMTEWSDETGVKAGTIWWRHENGITGQDLIKKGRLNRRSL